MPKLVPFRALRFDAASTDLSSVLAPPYDIISPAQRQELLARDPHNIVRIELPADLGYGDAAAYASAARTATAWRQDGILVKDAEPTVTVHQMRWIDRDGSERSATGLIARLALEEYGPGSGVLPHERTHGGPKEDRYQLLDATQLNTAPLVFLSGSDPAATSTALLALTARTPDAEATTADGVSHRLWVCDEDEAGTVLALMSSAPLTIADGHHRYETALKYRADRAGSTNGSGPDPAWAYVMALVYPLDQAPPALPTHRLLRGEPAGEQLFERLERIFDIERLEDDAALLARMAEPASLTPDATGTGRVGVYTDGLAAILRVRPASLEPMLEPGLSAASRGLDVNALTVAIEVAYGSALSELVADGGLWYEKDARDAVEQVRQGAAATTFLLDLMPASAIAQVAAAGEVMPQKSTYFDPKAPTGMLLGPLEW